MNTTQLLRVAAIALCSLAFAGCHMSPNFGPQGTIGMQRNYAVLHDPFPNNEIGPPVVGGRPRGFEQPWPQARINQDTPYARRGSRVAPLSGF